MWNPVKIAFKNLFSHVESCYEFVPNRTCLLYGKNNDDAGSNSNGAGKSVIIDAITLAITGQTSRDVSPQDFINDDADMCMLWFTIQKGEDVVIIHRVFKRKGSSKASIIYNDKVLDYLTSVKEKNEYIYNLLGIDRQDLLNFFIINQGNNSSFLTANDQKQKEIIGSFANFGLLDQMVADLKEDKKEFEEQIHVHNNIMSRIDGKIEALKEQIATERQSKLTDVEQLTAGLKEELAELVGEKEKLENSISKLSEEKISYRESKNKLLKLITKYKPYKSKRLALKKRLGEMENSVIRKKQRISHLKQVKSGAIQCPECEHEFLLVEEDVKLENIDRDIKVLNESISSVNTVTAQLKKDILDTAQGINKLEEAQELLEQVENHINDTDWQIRNKEKRVNLHIPKQIRDINKKIQKIIENVGKNSSIEGLSKNVAKLVKENKVNKVKLIKLQRDLNNTEFWILNFGNGGFKSFLANKTIQVLEMFINSHIKSLNTDLRVNIKGYTKLKSGEIRDKIEVFVTKNGQDIGKYARYSGGQQSRVNICTILALHKLLNQSTEGKGLNLLILDENFEGLDYTGQDEVLKLLDSTKITNVVITHNTHKDESQNLPYKEIILENGISQIT